MTFVYARYQSMFSVDELISIVGPPSVSKLSFPLTRQHLKQRCGWIHVRLHGMALATCSFPFRVFTLIPLERTLWKAACPRNCTQEFQNRRLRYNKEESACAESLEQTREKLQQDLARLRCLHGSLMCDKTSAGELGASTCIAHPCRGSSMR